MKKILLLTYILLSGFCLTAQIPLDSAHFVDAIRNGGAIADTVWHDSWIPFIPNYAVRLAAVAIASWFAGHFFGKKKGAKK